MTESQKRKLILPPKLKQGDQIRVLALSRTIGGIMKLEGFTQDDIDFARERLETLGFEVTFGSCVMDCNDHLTASPQVRIEDFNQAMRDPAVKAILAVAGGIGAIQLLQEIDYDLVASNPKILCGYSDLTCIFNAIFAKTGMISYYGPNFSGFMMKEGFDYTLQSFKTCLCEQKVITVYPSDKWSDDNWPKDQYDRTFHPNDGFWPISEGRAEGTIIGGAMHSFSNLQGSEFFPSLDGSILFLESPGEGKATLMALDVCIRTISFQKDFDKIRGIVLGRYSENSRVNRNNLTELIKSIPAIANIPVVANVDFGHTTPVITFPIGGKCLLDIRGNEIRIEYS